MPRKIGIATILPSVMASRKLRRENWNDFEADMGYLVKPSRKNKKIWRLKHQVRIGLELTDFTVASRA